jgi:AraC-like DNA-binding protein/quercetin dioxygenase-like cupin family protein
MGKVTSKTEDKTVGIIYQKDNLSPENERGLDTQNALTVYIGDKPQRVFLTYGFYYHRNDFSSYHSHSYHHEIIVLSGNCEFIVGDEVLKLDGTNIIAMPPKVYHKLITTENVLACTFFLDAPINFTVKALPEEISRLFFKECERAYETNDHSIVLPYISLILSYCASDNNKLEPESVTDYAFLMDSFLNAHYMDEISLEDLAEHLHVSPSHAHRLVQKHIGVSFTEAVTLKRLKVADYLVKFRDMNLTEAADAVGFRNYTAFWKARTKYKDKY